MSVRNSESSEVISDAFGVIAKRMASEGLCELAIDTFKHYYNELREGKTGLIDSTMILPVDSLPDLEKLSDSNYYTRGQEELPHTIMIKLNGGLGTSMGLDKAKSLLTAKDDYSFIDIIVKQVSYLRSAYSCSMPLLFMNSFRTEQDTLEVMKKYPDFLSVQAKCGLPISFIQNKVPKICVKNFCPVAWNSDPEMEWCPPGHGDLYTSLVQGGLLYKLLDCGYRYAFVSNSDNLGAVVDEKLLGYFAESGASFLMEVADRTEADKKGGHLACNKRDGRLLLRELAQCPESEQADFQDVSKYQYFNTNSLWLDLRALSETLKANDNVIKLPLIRNCKNIDPNNSLSPKVYQLETAMGAAISAFDNAKAVRVPRTRFAPVKKTDDLIVLWSDRYVLEDSGKVVQSHVCETDCISVELDSNYFRTVPEFKKRFSKGVPSLKACKKLSIKGDVAFGRGVSVVGSVLIENSTSTTQFVKDDAVVSCDVRW